jgi:cytidylate kinase
MKLIIIYGAPAVGKLTTANQLSKKTGYPVLHNHMTIDLVASFFSFNTEPFYQLLREIRLDIVKELLNQKTPGLIWTSGLPNTPDNKKFYKNLENLIEKNGGTVRYIKLVCDAREQKVRVLNKDRKKYSKLNTHDSLAKGMDELDFTTTTSEEKTIVIDNTNLSLQKVVSKILEFLNSKNSN